ncbi:MAG: hypothetical protein IIY04_06040 [Oscillospiraceae bacterium]|nr:hypothetical protein [Oscillospiraceae bacterium]
MIKQWLNFTQRIKAAFFAHWYFRAAVYAVIIAAVFAVWLIFGGESVAFLYSEF